VVCARHLNLSELYTCSTAIAERALALHRAPGSLIRSVVPLTLFQEEPSSGRQSPATSEAYVIRIAASGSWAGRTGPGSATPLRRRFRLDNLLRRPSTTGDPEASRPFAYSHSGGDS
jgi:hypothetical protein